MRLIDADTENERLLDFIAQHDSGIQYAIEHKDMTMLEDIFLDYFNEQETIDMGISALEEIMQYRAIGTVEECREAVERQKERKPIRIDMCNCPKCGTYNETVKKRRNTVKQDIVYCWYCGQAMEVNRSDMP